MKQPIKAGVAGAGVFGGHHAQKYAQAEGVALAGVFDPDPGRAQALAQRFGARAFTELDAFLAAVDVVSITAPAAAHAALGLAALEAGRAVYVEKPLAAALVEAEALVEAAERAGVPLACGHQERESLRALGLLEPGRPRLLGLEAVREGPWSGRGADVSVVLDLMIHDLDFALALTNAEPIAVSGEARRVHSACADEARASVTFPGGCAAVLRASRAAAQRARTLWLHYGEGSVQIDFLSGEVRDAAGLGLPARLVLADPLGAAIARFAAAARGEGEPGVSGREGLAAVRAALAVERAADASFRG